MGMREKKRRRKWKERRKKRKGEMKERSNDQCRGNEMERDYSLFIIIIFFVWMVEMKPKMNGPDLVPHMGMKNLDKK